MSLLWHPAAGLHPDRRISSFQKEYALESS